MLDSKLGGKQEKLFEGNNQSSPLLLPSHHFSASLSMAKLLFPWSHRISLPFKHFFVWKLLLGHISRYLGKSDPSTFPVGVHILILAETSAIDLPPSKMTCHFQGHRYCQCCCLFRIFFAWVLILIFAETSAIDLPPSRVDPSPSLSPNLVSIGSTHSISCPLARLEIFQIYIIQFFTSPSPKYTKRKQVNQMVSKIKKCIDG